MKSDIAPTKDTKPIMQIGMYIQFKVRAQWATVSCIVLLLS